MPDDVSVGQDCGLLQIVLSNSRRVILCVLLKGFAISCSLATNHVLNVDEVVALPHLILRFYSSVLDAFARSDQRCVGLACLRALEVICASFDVIDKFERVSIQALFKQLKCVKSLKKLSGKNK